MLAQSASPPHAVGCMVLPGLSVDVQCFHVSLADILVAQLWAAFGSLSRCQLFTKNVFWDEAILHAVDMTEPTLSCQDMPRIRRDTSQVEGVESFLLSGICGLRLTDLQSVLMTTDIVHYHLSLHCQFGVGPHS